MFLTILSFKNYCTNKLFNVNYIVVSKLTNFASGVIK